MYSIRYTKLFIYNKFKANPLNFNIIKRQISDICETKIIPINKSKEYDKLKIYRNNIYNDIYENQIIQGVKVHNLDPHGYGEIALYVTKQYFLLFLKFFLLIPDEQVNLKVLDINKKKKKITFQVLCKNKKSKYEIIPECEHFSKCGGCMYQHINYDFERKLKKDLLISLCLKYKINILISNKNYLQDDYHFVKEDEKNDEDFVTISEIKQEYMSNDLDNEQGEENSLNNNSQIDQNYSDSHIYYNSNTGDSDIYENHNNQINKKHEHTKIYDIIHSDCYHYRNKSTFHFSVTDKLSIGFYKRHSYEICDINECYIQDKQIQKIYEDIKNEIIDSFKKNNIYIVNKINNNGYLKSVDIKYSVCNSENQILINFIGSSLTDKAKKNMINIANNLAIKNKSIKGILYNIETNKLKQIKKEITLFGQNYIHHTYNNYTYKLGANTFFQPNQYLNEYIIQIVFKLIQNYKINSQTQCVFDLFCGIGFYSLPLSSMFNHVISVDYSIENIKNLEENIKLNNIQNIKPIHINLFNPNDLKQINLHIRRYIVNIIKNKNHNLYSNIKTKIDAQYASIDNENEFMENLQKSNSPYTSLPKFVYQTLIEWESKELNKNTSNDIDKNFYKNLTNATSQDLKDHKSDTLSSNEIGNGDISSNDFVISIPDLIIINPPRKGCEKLFRRWLRGICPRFIIYISCNVNSQLRDINHLISLGYILKEMIPIDTFPRTQHFELIALLEFDYNKKVDNEKKKIMELELHEIKKKKS
ncbi:SAM dependent methyltransferase, putative [Plasmodium chabaudi adami]|uniref:SAM dependent methyltransferase, putative n=1 Tax=Plasmodium chabaudi adami TaxID=5826 RepID=A0A1C6YLX1_PLACE|nr:SAM dependent methyltransferase, putative [Plasmodium chabaudi adami]